MSLSRKMLLLKKRAILRAMLGATVTTKSGSGSIAKTGTGSSGLSRPVGFGSAADTHRRTMTDAEAEEMYRNRVRDNQGNR